MATFLTLATYALSGLTALSSDFTSPMDRIYPDTLSELLEQSQDTDGAIYGNPLLYDECANALIDEHEHNLDDILQNSGIPTPWFWSAETLDATVKHLSLHRRLKVTSKVSNIFTLTLTVTFCHVVIFSSFLKCSFRGLLPQLTNMAATTMHCPITWFVGITDSEMSLETIRRTLHFYPTHPSPLIRTSAPHHSSHTSINPYSLH